MPGVRSTGVRKTDRGPSGRPLAAVARNDDSDDMDMQPNMPRTEQAWPRLVTPKQEEIRYAEELRRRESSSTSFGHAATMG